MKFDENNLHFSNFSYNINRLIEINKYSNKIIKDRIQGWYYDKIN